MDLRTPLAAGRPGRLALACATPSISRPALLVLAALLAIGVPAGAQEDGAAPRRVDCSSADHRAFDFWVGEWDVYDPRGERVGENTVTRIEDGCALHERWRATSGGTGQSLNYYDASDGRWYQTWVATSGRPLRLVGGPRNGGMVMEMEAPDAHHRITWTPNDDGSVRQLWETSTDAGETWRIAFDGEYRPDPDGRGGSDPVSP